jgi:hypothetical protein
MHGHREHRRRRRELRGLLRGPRRLASLPASGACTARGHRGLHRDPICEGFSEARVGSLPCRQWCCDSASITSVAGTAIGDRFSEAHFGS